MNQEELLEGRAFPETRFEVFLIVLQLSLFEEKGIHKAINSMRENIKMKDSGSHSNWQKKKDHGVIHQFLLDLS